TCAAGKATPDGAMVFVELTATGSAFGNDSGGGTKPPIGALSVGRPPSGGSTGGRKTEPGGSPGVPMPPGGTSGGTDTRMAVCCVLVEFGLLPTIFAGVETSFVTSVRLPARS